MSEKLDYKINVNLFAELFSYKDKLPIRAPGRNGHGEPAGLALLGKKDNLVDRSVFLKMSGGCWDSPTISYNNMDIGFRKLIKEEREVIGMALIRHPGHDHLNSEFKQNLPGDLKHNIHRLKNTFKDITKTIWIVVADDTYRIFRVKKDLMDRIVTYEVSTREMCNKSKQFIKKTKVKPKKEKKVKKIKDPRMTEIKKINKAFKEEKESLIPIGNGYSFMKSGNGKYILWRTQ